MPTHHMKPEEELKFYTSLWENGEYEEYLKEFNEMQVKRGLFTPEDLKRINERGRQMAAQHRPQTHNNLT